MRYRYMDFMNEKYSIRMLLYRRFVADIGLSHCH